MPPWIPYAQRPVRRVRQVAADLLVAGWVTVWVLVGVAVHKAVATLAQVGYGLESGADSLAGNLGEAGSNVGRLPLVGDEVATPLTGAANAARGLADSGADLGDKITWLALVLALAVAVPPALTVVVVWFVARYRFGRQAAAVRNTASGPGGRRLLALRAMNTQPLRQLAKVGPDPVGAWERGDTTVIDRLAGLELSAAGMRLPDVVLGPEGD